MNKYTSVLNRTASSFKLLILGVTIAMITLMASGCGSKPDSTLVEGKVNVVTSFYPLYDFAKNIGGEHVNVINMIPAGIEPHDWTPKSRDIDNASKAQLFLYNGAGLEGWVDDFLKGLDAGSKPVTVEVSKGIELIHGNPEEAEGHEEGHDEAASEQHDHGDYDPHTWVSPKSALIMAENIKNSLIEVDAAHKSDYEANYKVFADKLKQLDEKFASSIASAPRKEIVVSHQAFGYLCRDYGLTQMPIMGLSPDAEPRSQDIVNISKFVKDHDVKYIFFEELVSDTIAKTIAGETGAKTLVLNPIEGLTGEEEQKGEDYVSLMESNLQNLMKALQ